MYEIIEVQVDAGHLEPMGSKPKFWFEHGEHGVCLFKAARPGTGEDWSEKIAEQLAGLLGIPHASYELAVCQGENGIVTPRMTTEDQDLVHGNEILIELDRGYAEGSTGYRTPMHTVDAVMGALRARVDVLPPGWQLPDGVEEPTDVFVGYLLLDALIANTDRHHENWAAVRLPAASTDSDTTLALAPTFDHASSLGRNEPPARMIERLETNDEGFTVEAYASRARSALYRDAEDDKPLTPLEAFLAAGSLAPGGAFAWCEKLFILDREAVETIVHKVPEARLPERAKEFVVRMLLFNRENLEDACHDQ